MGTERLPPTPEVEIDPYRPIPVCETWRTRSLSQESESQQKPKRKMGSLYTAGYDVSGLGHFADVASSAIAAAKACIPEDIERNEVI